MGSQGLTGQPLSDKSGAFNWIFLIEFITNGILALFFLFYFNRVLAAILSYAIRLISWHRFHVYIEIQSLQISLLAGRIFFKGVRYHGDNETFFVHSGFITWRYWLFAVRDCQIHQNEPGDTVCSSSNSARSHGNEKQDPKSPNIVEQAGAGKQSKSLPCRITAEVTGFEAFVYNRSPAYDIIIDNIAKRENARTSGNSTDSGSNVKPGNGRSFSDPGIDADVPRDSSRIDTSDSDGNSLNLPKPKKHSPPFFLRLLPIYVECKTGAAVLGNENTQAVITAKFDSASGEFDATHAGELDIFKILMEFEVIHPVVQMKPNVDFRKPQLVEAAALSNDQEKPFDALEGTAEFKSGSSRFPKLGISNYLRLPLLRRKSTESVRATAQTEKNNHGPYADYTFLPAQERWRGLTRYLDDTQQDQRQEWEGVEYARTSMLADVTSVNFKFYWDIPGNVPASFGSRGDKNPGESSDINRSPAPEYGMELNVRGGMINYGPWADRHRVVLQQIFFPMSYTDSVPEPQLKVGETRVPTLFKLFLNIEAETTVRIPFREPSKDWKWKGRASTVGGSKKSEKSNVKDKKSKKTGRNDENKMRKEKRTAGTDTRPFSWFDIKVQSDTTVNYTMDMYCGDNGYENKLNVEVSALEVFSSLNHGLLLRSERVSIKADLSNPLVWNELRAWLFEITIWKLDLFLLRDHTFLLVDLIEDWSVGPPQEFYTFIPFRYLIKTHLFDFRLFLNTNDANIINSPEDLEDNDFVILYGKTIQADLTVPIDQYRPRNSDITFNVEAHDLGFELSLPPRNTVNALLVDKNVAQLPAVYLFGVYTNCSEIQSGLTETLNISIDGQGLLLKFFGFFGRQLIKIKENYFGDNVNFKTLDEYQDLVRRRERGEAVETPPMKSNDLDVILDITATDTNILIPAALYNCEEHVRLRVETANVDLRVSNYYLELMVNSSPVEFSFTKKFIRGSRLSSETSNTQISIDGVKCYGHRLFGLPPSEPSYVDNWDIDVGDFIGECSSAFLEVLVAAGRATAMSVLDSENASSIALLPTMHDTTFVRFCCLSVRVWVKVEEFAFCIKTGKVDGSFTDYAGRIFSQKLRMNIPDFSIFCINSHDALRQPAHNRYPVQPLAYLGTSVTFTMVQRSPDFDLNRRLQQDHIATNDARTHRVPFLVHKRRQSFGQHSEMPHAKDPVSLPLPSLPAPLQQSSFRQSIDRHQELPHFNTATRSQNHSRPEVRQPLGVAQPTTTRTKGSSVNLSSPFKPLVLSLDIVELDLTDVPTFQQTRTDQSVSEVSPRPELDFIDKFHDDDILQTSFLVSTEPSVNAFCNAEAVLAIAALTERILPKDPERVLDSFQINAYGEVLSAFSKRNGQNESLNFSLRVPEFNARFVNISDESITGAGIISDQYDLNVTNLVTAARVKTLPQRPNESSSNSLHATLGSVRVAAQEGAGKARQEDFALESYIDDILIWMVDSDRTSIHASFRDAKASLVSKKIEYLARLIHRTTMMVDKFNNKFSKVAAAEEYRLQYLVYQLISQGNKVPDPLFVTRPSHSLRNNSEHIRSSDTWKIVARLRYIYHSLSEEQKTQLAVNSLDQSFLIPKSAQDTVLESLEQWRSWDTSQVRESFAIRILYGSMTGIEKLHDRSKIPVSMAVQSKGLKFLIDPGPSQSMLFMDELAIGLRVTPPLPPAAVQLFPDREDNVKTSVVHIGVREIAVRINWEICELAELILDLFNERAPGHIDDTGDNALTVSQTDTNSEPQRYHVVFVADTGSLRLDTINLSSSIATERLRVSAAGSQNSLDDEQVSVTLALTSRTTSIDLFGHQRPLFHFKVVNPSLYFAFQKLILGGSPTNALKIIAASHDLVFEVRDEILGLLEIVNSVTTDEAAYFKRLTDSHRMLATRAKKIKVEEKLDIPLKVNISLFLNTYDIQVAFLNDLIYATTGHSVRLSVISLTQEQPQFQIEYDLKAQSHRLLASALRKEILAELDLPPINGTFNLLVGPQFINLSALVSVEEIELDGSAVYAILSTFSSPRVLKAIDSIKEDVRAVKAKVQDTFDLTKEPQRQDKVKSKQIFLFDTAIAFAGLTVFADTPGVKEASPPARMIYNMGPLHIKAWNHVDGSQVELPFPEFRVVLKRTTLEIMHTEHDAFQAVGTLDLGAHFTCAVDPFTDGRSRRKFTLSIDGPHVQFFADTAPTAIEILHHVQKRIKHLDLSREKNYLRRLRHLDNTNKTRVVQENIATSPDELDADYASLTSELSFDVHGITISYSTKGSVAKPVSPEIEDLVLSLERISLIASTEAEAKLNITDLKLALVPSSSRGASSSRNYAVMPEIVFNVALSSTETDRKLTFNAAGKPLDIQLDPHFILPAIDLHRSLAQSSVRARDAAKKLDFGITVPSNGSPAQPQKRNLFGKKRLSEFLIDAEFAGAMMTLQARTEHERHRPTLAALHLEQVPRHGKYGQFGAEGVASSASLLAPGIAFKVRYLDKIDTQASIDIEIRVDGTNNVLYPTVTPLILHIINSVKQAVRDSESQSKQQDVKQEVPKPDAKAVDEESFVQADPRAILGKTKLNIGLRICKQELTLSCQPIAKVAAVAKLEDIYVTFNSVDSIESGHFFAASAKFAGLGLSLRHVYSRETTFGFDIESIVFSFMNSKHISGTSGISTILKINPSKMQINAKQFQDILLFREIWFPSEIRNATTNWVAEDPEGPQEHFVQRYRQVAASTAFPWNATVTLVLLSAEIDLGQSIGKMSLNVSNLWASSKKSTSSFQDLCVGIDGVSIKSSGRLSGEVDLEKVKVRTSISWPSKNDLKYSTPLVQGSLGFGRLIAKMAFDYQTFAIVDITSFEFIMYNVREEGCSGDRLVAILDGDDVNAYCIASTAAICLSMGQAFERLIQEKEAAYEESINDIDKFLRRKSSAYTARMTPSKSKSTGASVASSQDVKLPLSLHTDVVVTLRSINIGAFPTTLLDHQVLRVEASDIQARFAASLESKRIHSSLGLTLGQLRVALAAIPHARMPKKLGEITVEDVISNAASGKGGVILRVPKVLATMQTWQGIDSKVIDYIFRSTFEGKIDVGWNYSRISFIRGMWGTHTRTLASRLGKPLPESAVKITGAPEASPPEEGVKDDSKPGLNGQQKITAVVNLPQSKYTYRALEPSVIDTPQLRDMGEATPPLEWVGLQRDKLPNVTHQIVIVTLLQIAKEVEDAYSRTLGIT